MLISGNSILGDHLEADNAYDGIYAETVVPGGIENLSILGNKIFALKGSSRYRYGINLADNVVLSKCGMNHIQNIATAVYNVGATCSGIEIDKLGGGPLEPPGIPPSGEPLVNPFHSPITIYVAGGDVSSVAIGGVPTGLGMGTFSLAVGQTITLSYSDAPTWTWVGS